MHALRSAAATTFVAVAALTAHAPIASAHDALVGSQPGANTTVTRAPDQLTLTFNEPVLDLGNRMSVTEPGGTTRTLTTKVAGTSVTAPFTEAGNGTYTVTWRVTSEDGHPVSGQYAFTLKARGANAAGSAVSSTSIASLGSASPSSSSVVGPSTPTTNEPGDNEPLLVIGGAIVAALALAGGFLVARRRVRDDAR